MVFLSAGLGQLSTYVRIQEPFFLSPFTHTTIILFASTFAHNLPGVVLSAMSWQLETNASLFVWFFLTGQVGRDHVSSHLVWAMLIQTVLLHCNWSWLLPFQAVNPEEWDFVGPSKVHYVWAEVPWYDAHLVTVGQLFLLAFQWKKGQKNTVPSQLLPVYSTTASLLWVILCHKGPKAKIWLVQSPKLDCAKLCTHWFLAWEVLTSDWDDWAMQNMIGESELVLNSLTILLIDGSFDWVWGEGTLQTDLRVDMNVVSAAWNALQQSGSVYFPTMYKNLVMSNQCSGCSQRSDSGQVSWTRPTPTLTPTLILSQKCQKESRLFQVNHALRKSGLRKQSAKWWQWLSSTKK